MKFKTRSIATFATVVVLAVLGTACVSSGSGNDSVAEKPKNVEADLLRRAAIRVELASSYYQQGNMAVAIDEANESLRIVPNYPQALGMLGLIYMSLKENAKAEPYFQRSLQASPNDPDLNLNYGWFLCQTGRERESIPMFLTAARDPLYRSPARPYQNAGICSRRVARDGDAESYLRKSLELEPTNSVSIYYLAEVMLAKGDFGSAETLSNRLLNGLDASPQSLWLAIRVQKKLGSSEQVSSLASQLRRRSSELQMFLQGRYE
jgi:type IV pilus assembly protein PilF